MDLTRRDFLEACAGEMITYDLLFEDEKGCCVEYTVLLRSGDECSRSFWVTAVDRSY